MISASTRRRRKTGIGQKLLMLAGGLFCFALILIPLLWKPQPQTEESAETPAATNSSGQKKSQHPWNIALGNVVMVAPELGLAVKAPNELKIESGRLATIIDSQLISLRELYRAETATHARMIGAMLVEFTVGEAGQIKHAQEIAARINNPDFRKAALAEIHKWNFDGMLPDGAVVRCPLIFVREGMEINTVLEWEKQLGLFDDKPSSAAAARPAAVNVSSAPARDAQPTQHDKTIENPHDYTLAPLPTRDAGRSKKNPAKAPGKSRRDAFENEQETRSSFPTERSEM